MAKLLSLLSLMLMVALPAVSGAQGTKHEVFREVSGTQGDHRPHPAAIGTIHATVDLSAFGQLQAPPESGAQARLLNLDVLSSLDAKGLVARLDHTETLPSGRVAWMGEIEGVRWSSVTLVVDLANKTVTGSISYPGGVYQIGHESNGVHVITRLDPSHGADDVVLDPRENPRYDEIVTAGATRGAAAASGDSGARIDLLVVYTQAARAAAGGVAAMQSLVDLAVAETNQSYQNSGITPRVRLVHSAEVVYTEAGFSTDLTRLQATSDGFVDNVHALRDQYGADAVAMIVESSTSCGIAYLGQPSASFAPWAFQVTARNCATGYFTFGHELGHNQAARHDWFVDSTNNSPYTYNKGYVSPDSTWRTIMAYANACSGCTRVQYWSNPDVTRNGLPMGVPEGQFQAADNRKTLNNTAPFVANFRQEIMSGLPAAASLVSPLSTAPVQPTYTWNVASGATQYYLWVQESGSTPLIQTWYTSAVCGATTCSVTPSTTLSAGRTYQWWIQTWNATGYGPWSSTGSFQVAAATTLPIAATLQSPTGTVAGSLTPTYTWAKVDNSTWYYLWVNQNGSPVIQTWFTSAAVCGSTTCSVTPSRALASGVTAQWWIQTYNGAGYGPWSAAASFVPLVAPGAATLVSPSGNVSTATPTYVWNKVNDSTWYYLWVTQNGAPVIQTWFTSAAVCGASTCSVTPSRALGAGPATWWIQTYNEAGYGPWSAGSTLTVTSADGRHP